MTGPVVDRRAVLTNTLMLPLLVAPGAAVAKKPTRRAYADTHTHLFNVHDLPVTLFLVDVLFRERTITPGLKAVIDYLARWGQRHAISADVERRRLVARGAKAVEADPLTPKALGDAFAQWATQDAFAPENKSLGPMPFDEAELRAGYGELIDALVAESRGTTIDSVQKRFGESLHTPARQREVARAFADLARRSDDPGRVPPGDGIFGGEDEKSDDDSCRTACVPHRFSMSLAAILRYLGWAILMLKSRERHLLKYVELAARRREVPRVIVNHLLDYDAWLGTTPLSGSSHPEQVEMGHALAVAYRPGSGRGTGVELATFAGFCPLKHALEARRTGRPRLLDTMLGLADAKKVAGFKLYPPMGFRASGNRGLQNSAFDPGSRYRAQHYRQWSAEFGGAPTGNEIGTALDGALEEFYAACVARNLPIMAHAGPGNSAGPGFGERANPAHWVAVAERHALRISLGHLVNSARDFVCALSRGDAPECVWVLHGGRALLDPTNTRLKATVYGDLAFMPELIENPTLAVAFFKGLRAVFGEKDPELTRITYGSDYIVLGWMKDYGAHLQAMRTAMAKAGYTSEQVENILVNNARRFLRG